MVNEPLDTPLTGGEAALLTTKLQLPTDYLSPTQIGMYQRCPRQYRFRYVLGVKRPPGVALVEGKAHHAALQMNNRHKIDTGADLPMKNVSEAFCDRFSDESSEVEDWEGEKADAVIDRGRKLLKQYLEGFALKYRPEIVEHRLFFDVGGVPVLGYLDTAGRLTGPGRSGKTVIDYKVSGRKRSKDELEGSPQLSFYGWGSMSVLRTRLPRAGFCTFIKGSPPSVVWQPAPMDAARVRWFRRLALSVADAISRGSFPLADPTHWCCSKRFCGYWDLCHGR